MSSPNVNMSFKLARPTSGPYKNVESHSICFFKPMIYLLQKINEKYIMSELSTHVGTIMEDNESSFSH